MNRFLLMTLAVISLSASAMEQSNTDFSVVNALLGSVSSNLPNGCQMERDEPLVVSRSPVLVNYRYTLKKGMESTSITFEQSQNDFTVFTDNQSFEEVRSSDNKLIVRFNAQGEITFLRVNQLECSL